MGQNIFRFLIGHRCRLVYNKYKIKIVNISNAIYLKDQINYDFLGDNLGSLAKIIVEPDDWFAFDSLSGNWNWQLGQFNGPEMKVSLRSFLIEEVEVKGWNGYISSVPPSLVAPPSSVFTLLERNGKVPCYCYQSFSDFNSVSFIAWNIRWEGVTGNVKSI